MLFRRRTRFLRAVSRAKAFFRCRCPPRRPPRVRTCSWAFLPRALRLPRDSRIFTMTPISLDESILCSLDTRFGSRKAEAKADEPVVAIPRIAIVRTVRRSFFRVVLMTLRLRLLNGDSSNHQRTEINVYLMSSLCRSSGVGEEDKEDSVLLWL